MINDDRQTDIHTHKSMIIQREDAKKKTHTRIQHTHTRTYISPTIHPSIVHHTLRCAFLRNEKFKTRIQIFAQK